MTKTEVTSEYITEEMKLELEKCSNDKSREYMISQYLTTYDFRFKDYVNLIPFEEQSHILKSYGENNNTIVKKYRQSGITTITCGYIACEMVLNIKFKGVYVTPNYDLSKMCLNKIAVFLQQIPRWFWGKDYCGTPENESKSIFIKNNNKLIQLVNGAEIHSVSTVNNFRGIGKINHIICDEASFLTEEMHDNCFLCEFSNENVKTIKFSTPYYEDKIFEAYFKDRTNKFNKISINWFNDPRYNVGLKWFGPRLEADPEIVKKNSPEKLLFLGFIPTSEWYKKMVQNYNYNKNKIEQEIWANFVSKERITEEKNIEFKDKILKILNENSVSNERYVQACLNEIKNKYNI